MAIDTTPTPTADASPSTAVDARTHARRGLLLLAFALWNLWLWGTRTYNLFTSDESQTTGFIVVHVALYVLSTAVAVVFGVMGWHMRREARA